MTSVLRLSDGIKIKIDSVSIENSADGPSGFLVITSTDDGTMDLILEQERNPILTLHFIGAILIVNDVLIYNIDRLDLMDYSTTVENPYLTTYKLTFVYNKMTRSIINMNTQNTEYDEIPIEDEGVWERLEYTALNDFVLRCSVCGYIMKRTDCEYNSFKVNSSTGKLVFPDCPCCKSKMTDIKSIIIKDGIECERIST